MWYNIDLEKNKVLIAVYKGELSTTIMVKYM